MSSAEKPADFLPARLFNRIMKCVPIVSVEALIVTDDGLLFLMRATEPVKGEWWLPGGRIHRGESLLDALRREVKEETSLNLSSCRLLNVYSRVLPERHDITIAYKCSVNQDKVVLNEEHSEYAFFKKLPHHLHPFMREVVADSGWKNG